MAVPQFKVIFSSRILLRSSRLREYGEASKSNKIQQHFLSTFLIMDLRSFQVCFHITPELCFRQAISNERGEYTRSWFDSKDNSIALTITRTKTNRGGSHLDALGLFLDVADLPNH